ncbi:MAG: dTDP-4-dehydrorhamnose 3,5-epimerase [Bacteroidales bacterium]|nr:dTDP-4-dehydrorhamnose 3,5-epimerase [Bacteroidales bacterium]
MQIEATSIPDVIIIKPDLFRDERGYFMESFHAEKFKQMGIETRFVQDNESLSQKGVLRGLHFQKSPWAQGKLVRVIQGAVLDVAVDIRKSSPTFGQWVSVTLSGENKWMCWIPEGFAHGFVTLEDNTVFSYKCTNFYHKDSEGSIRWDDPAIGIRWDCENPSLSGKDTIAPLLENCEILFP